MPSRDTTGCAAHLNIESAIDGALKELIERQCLLRYWITKSVKRELIINKKEYDLNQDTLSLISRLQGSGSLKLYDITIPGFPGYAVISLYGSADDSLTVQYCTGLSYGYSVKSAIEKSIIELWQSYAFLHFFKIAGNTVDDIDDSYHRHFWDCNKAETFYMMTAYEPDNKILLEDFIMCPSINRKILEEHLISITKNVFFYAKNELLNDNLIWYVRVFSPDFFIHMDGSSPLNNENSISKEFHVAYEDRRSSMVPFP
jgi:hypothetical protein